MKKGKSLRLRILISLLIFWLSINSYFFLVRLAGFILIISSTIGLICFIFAIISIIILIVRVLKCEDYKDWKNYAMIGFSVLFFVLIYFFPVQVTENTLQSPVKIRYCYEGTMNTSRLYLRENGKFEDFNIGFFGYVHYCKGKWEQSGDTIRLYSEKGKHKLLGKKLINKNDYLFQIEADTLLPTFYYQGNCKGLN